jgi:Protein of unknown function (DUF3754)
MEHFIPFRRTDVVSMCADELPAAERDSFAGFARMLSSLLHYRFHGRIEALKDAYHPFNPEGDTRAIDAIGPAERRTARERVEQELAALARAANFTEIDVAELQQALVGHSLIKVSMAIDTEVIDKVMLFRRGESTRTRTVPIWYGLRKRTVSFTNYSKVLVYAMFKDAGHFPGDPAKLPFRPGSMIIKLFQNVPADDLEMVFPNVQVRMRLFDKLLIGIPALISGITVIVTKLAVSLGVVLLFLAFYLGVRDKPEDLSQAQLISLAVGLAAFGGYLFRQVTKFKNRKILFMKALSENLYFRNLDNDAGVFHHLLDAAEEAEVMEALLAYHFLRTAPEPPTAAELDRRIQDWFATRWDTTLDFEVEDGVRKLRQLSLVTEDELGRLTAVGLAEAKKRLDHEWDNLFAYNDRLDSAAAPSTVAVS